MKFLRKLFLWAAFAGLVVFIYRKVKQSREMMKLSKSLPEFLKTVLGDGLYVTLNQGMNSIDVKVGVPDDQVDALETESIITEYIEDFYPTLAKCKLNIEVYTLDEECQGDCQEEPTGEDLEDDEPTAEQQEEEKK